MAEPTAMHDLAPTLAELGDPPRRAMHDAAQAGFRHVQLSATRAGMRPRDLDRSARRDVTRTLERFGLAPAGLDLWIPVAHWNDPARVDRAAQACAEAARFAADLGRLPLCMTLPDASTTEAADAVIGEAQRHGVAIVDHRVPPSDDARVGLGVDPAAWLAAGADPIEGLVAGADRLGSVRLSDLLIHGGRCPPGSDDGQLDLRPYRRTLEVVWHGRPIVLDLRGWPDAWAGIDRAVAAWRTAGAA